MSVYDPDSANLTTWSALVEKQSKGLSPDDFTWHTPEGIPLKTLYTAEDTEQLPYTNTCLLYTSPSPRDLSTSRMPSSA